MSYSPRLLLLTLCAASAACATTPASRASRAMIAHETSRPDSVVVRVVNHVDRPVTVYRMHAGTRAALGQVQAGDVARFPLAAADAAGKLTLAASPAGSRTAVESAPFRVERGQVAVFMITPELSGSQVFVDWPAR